MAWAFSKLSLYNKELFDALSQAATIRLAHLDTAQLTCVLWGFARVRHPCRYFLESATPYLVARMETARPSEIAATLQAFAKLRVYDAAVMKAAQAPLITYAVKRKLLPTVVANVLSVYAVFLYRDAGFLV